MRAYNCGCNIDDYGPFTEAFLQHRPDGLHHQFVVGDLPRSPFCHELNSEHRLVHCLRHPFLAQFFLEDFELADMQTASECDVSVGVEGDAPRIEVSQDGAQLGPDLACVVDPCERVWPSAERGGVGVEEHHRAAMRSMCRRVLDRPPDRVFRVLPLAHLPIIMCSRPSPNR